MPQFSSSWWASSAAVRQRETEREGAMGAGWTQTACASTRDLPHSRLSTRCSLPPFLLSLSFLLVFFFFYFFVHLLPFCLILSPAVLPPFVPALHTEDDTSNFEEPEQAAPRPGSAAQQGALPLGFQGQDLPFLGWFFSRPLATLAKAE